MDRLIVYLLILLGILAVLSAMYPTVRNLNHSFWLVANVMDKAQTSR